MKWDHVGIKCADIDKSLAFYCDLLGFEIQEKLEIMGKTFYFVGNESTSIEMEAGNPGDTQIDPRFQTGQNHLSFLVDDVQAMVDRLKDKGVPILLEPFPSRPDRLTSFIEDPDGVFIQMIQLLDKPAE